VEVAKLPAEYVLPLRWTSAADGTDEAGLSSLTTYLAVLGEWIDVTVVDGSPAVAFERHAGAWDALVRHVAPEPRAGVNGKVRGVMTGVGIARHDRVILADDDVRYDYDALARVVGALDSAELVRPQNYFGLLPWHARWDTARTLVNRAFGSDYPGTLGVRRNFLLAAGGYDGDVLFENLELIRTVRAAGGREVRADDLFVERLPPDVGHFMRQRVRQAYDGFAQPGRLAVELALLPLSVWASRRPGRAAVAVMIVIAVAEYGRRRAGGAAVFRAGSALWAPLWVIERAGCAWLAVWARLRGGVRYQGARLYRAATPARVLSARATIRRQGGKERT
jgi:hypothetical protein